MKRIHLSIAIITTLLLAACATNPKLDETSSSEPAQSEQNLDSKTLNTEASESSVLAAHSEKSYSLQDISTHASADDCWFAIEDKVYDVTPFIASVKHPGGAAILEGCGKDATQLFNSRPMGSGTPHSDSARKSLVKFEIGTLKQD